MAYEASPVDHETGMPLPVFSAYPEPWPGKAPESNWHHHFHPRRSPDLQDIGGAAVRHVRLQWVDRETHTRYHRQFEGPPLPADESGKFLLAVMASAGYVPDHAIRVGGMRPKVVRLRPERRESMRGSGELRNAGPDHVRRFIESFAVAQPLEHVPETLIDEFISLDPATAYDRKWFLGNWLLAQAVAVAAEPINPIYRRAWRSELIDTAHPLKPESFIASLLGRGKQRLQAIRALSVRLQAGYAPEPDLTAPLNNSIITSVNT